MVDRSWAGPIQPEARLDAKLRWLAGGAYQDIKEKTPPTQPDMPAIPTGHGAPRERESQRTD